MKITLADITESLKKNNIPAESIQKILTEIENKAEAHATPSTSSTPKSKKQFVIVVSDPEEKLKNIDLVGWVAQIEENESVTSIIDRINVAASTFNNSLKVSPTKRGRRSKGLAVKNVGEAFEFIPAKFWKTKGNTLVKTKTPVLLIKTDNKLKN